MEIDVGSSVQTGALENTIRSAKRPNPYSVIHIQGPGDFQ